MSACQVARIHFFLHRFLFLHCVASGRKIDRCLVQFSHGFRFVGVIYPPSELIAKGHENVPQGSRIQSFEFYSVPGRALPCVDETDGSMYSWFLVSIQ